MKYIKSLDESQFNEDFIAMQATKHGMTREEWVAHYASPSIGLGIDESFDTSTPNADDIGRYLVKLFAIRDQAHIFHWQTKSYARHMAFGDFYEDFIDEVDTLAEMIMGIKGDFQLGSDAAIILQDYNDANVNRFFERVYPVFDNELKMICDTEAHEEVFDQARVILALVDKLKYLLTLS